MTIEEQIQALKLLQRIDQLTEVRIEYVDEYVQKIVELKNLITK